MPVSQPKRLSNSARVKFLDAPEIIKELKSISRDIVKRNNNVLSIYLFGSLAKGNYSPGSDADILIVLKKDDRRFIDRMPGFLRLFLNAPIPAEVFPYTEEELKRMISNDNPFIISMLGEKTILA